jgi:arginyl-tRNA synthetase
MFAQELQTATKQIKAEMAKLGIPDPEKIEWASTPFSGQWGFGTAVCFQSAASEARSGKAVNVPNRAQEIALALSKKLQIPEGFSHAEAINGYLNLYIDPEIYALRVVDTILKEMTNFGKGTPNPERVMVEYSQPNTHKAFHVGHLRNVILGSAMANILEFAGFDTIRANYLGDIGWHVIKWLWCYLKFHHGEEPDGDRTRWMQELYSESTRLVEENPEYETEARKIFARWDAKDPELVELWKKTRRWSIEGFREIYEALGAEFDVFFYESEVEEPGKLIVNELIQRGLAIDERPTGGPVVIKLDEVLNLKKETYRVLVLLRSDGTSLYATKDLPLAIKKFEEWKVDRSIYVIDVRQSLYLSQIFKTLELMGYPQAKNCVHLSYEIVNLPGNVTMSSREGTVVMFDDLLEEAFTRAAAIVEEKNPNLTTFQKEEVSQSVALGALKYPLLAVDNNKTATFDWDRALDFEGQASPYIQYAHVRANSILMRADELPPSTQPQYKLHPSEIELLDRISQFPEIVQRSAEEYKPLLIANYAYELAQAFTSFYQHCPVLQAEENTRKFRLRLTAATRQVLANSLRIMGIPAPNVM